MKRNIVLLGAALLLMMSMAACRSGSTAENTEDSTEEINRQAMEANAMTDSMATALKEDAETVQELANAGLMEVELAKVALEKATSAKVREFAQMIIKDHTKANDDLRSLAESKNIVLMDRLNDENQKIVEDVAKENGKQFDRKYMDVMLDDHKKDVSKFQKIADNANDSDLKAYAANKLPTLIHHREEAEKLEKMTDRM